MKPGLIPSVVTGLAKLKWPWPRAEKIPCQSPGSTTSPRSKRKRAKGRKQRAQPPVFVTEGAFLRDLISVLTRDANENMHFLTGPKLDNYRVICRRAQPVALQQQSPVFVRASAKSVADVLIAIIEQGAELHVIAHSHPGSGPGATTPSGTDIACLGKLQKNGSPAIGCIVTRDNHVRFFTVSRAFRVLVQGTGVTEVTKNVFHIAPENHH
jgi:proteasome lid subunit RPN8/RPN11